MRSQADEFAMKSANLLCWDESCSRTRH